MHLLSVPNISEGRRRPVIDGAVDILTAAHTRVLDVHADETHNRAVLTCWAESHDLVSGTAALADFCREKIDLRRHEGLHPRLGALDVLPFVATEGERSLRTAMQAAWAAGDALADLGIPSVFYDAADPENRSLPDLRRGGLEKLTERISSGELAARGPDIDARTGVVCIGARSPLIAFNVWLDADPQTAKTIARLVRARDGGLPGVRAIGIDMSGGRSQVSMNLVNPERTGIVEAFEAVRELASSLGARVIRTELVGAPPRVYMPPGDAEAARLMSPPGRSLESLIRSD